MGFAREVSLPIPNCQLKWNSYLPFCLSHRWWSLLANSLFFCSSVTKWASLSEPSTSSARSLIRWQIWFLYYHYLFNVVYVSVYRTVVPVPSETVHETIKFFWHNFSYFHLLLILNLSWPIKVNCPFLVVARSRFFSYSCCINSCYSKITVAAILVVAAVHAIAVNSCCCWCSCCMLL